MKREFATVFVFFLALTSLATNDLRNTSADKKRDAEPQNSSKQQGGYMTPDGVYVAPSKPSSTIDLDKFLPRRSASPE